MVNPNILTDAARPPYAGEHRLVHRLLAEAWDHLWPWHHKKFRHNRAAQISAVIIALAATLVWILAALGKLQAYAVISWWFGWSLCEVMVRMTTKPYVKDGPWWGTHYRHATLMDMICYVAFKNLLIGAILFIGLKSLGLLHF
jgi:hypothetical protein